MKSLVDTLWFVDLSKGHQKPLLVGHSAAQRVGAIYVAECAQRVLAW